VLRFEDFSVADMLLCTADGAQLRARAEVLLAPLRDHPQLLEAVVAWFACDLNVNDAAARLHLHPNSLRYRLARVDEVTGRALHALPNLVDLYLALRSEARLPLEILQKAAPTSSSPTVPRPGRRS
jgi:purine catabolism regulator